MVPPLSDVEPLAPAVLAADVEEFDPPQPLTKTARAPASTELKSHRVI
jgi:hypothetical protein